MIRDLKAKISSTWKSSLFNSLLRAAGTVLSANVVGSLLGFLAIAIAARVMDLRDFGIFAIVTSYALFISRLVGFQSWQPVIRFIELPENADRYRRNLLFGWGLRADIIAAALATVVALAALPVMWSILNITDPPSLYVYCYFIVNATTIVGAPTASIRYFRRYDLVSGLAILSGAVKVAAICVALLTGGGLNGALVAWSVSHVIANLGLLVAGEYVARVNGATMLASAGLRDLSKFPGLVRSFVETNLVQTVKMLRDGDVMLVGFLLSVESAGLFRVARQIGDLAVKATDPLIVVLFPEFTRLMVRGGHRVSHQILLVCFTVFAVGSSLAMGIYLAFGKSALFYALGPRFAEAHVIFGVCILAGLVRATSQVAPAALLANGESRYVIYVTAAAGILYYGLAWVFGPLWGLNGVGVALLISNFIVAAPLVYRALTISPRQDIQYDSGPHQI